MKVLLVQPNYRPQRETGQPWDVNPPLGLCYIASALEQIGVEVKITEANALNLSVKDVVKEAKGYDVVGISFMTPAHNFAVRVARSLDKSVLKIAGGPHPTGAPGDVLRDGFDVVVRGEGEKTMIEIVKGTPLKDVLGISYKKGNKIINNKPRPLMSSEELDKMPLPARHLLPSNGVNMPYKSAATKRLPWSPIFATRGCGYNCYFCHKMFGYQTRFRSPESIVNEMAMLKEKYGVKEIDFYDDCFNADMKFAHKVMDAIIARNLKLHFRFSNGIRINHIDKKLLRKFKKAGVDWISFGIESGNQEVLNRIPKAITLDQIRRAVRMTKKEGITVCGFMILGLLGDTRETMQQTIDFAKELDLDLAVFGMLTPYPGSHVWDEIKKNGEFLVKNWDDFHHTTARMTFRHPDVAAPDVVEEMYKKAHKEFYMRPRYILKKAASINNIQDVKFMLNGLRSILRIERLKGK